MKIDKSLVEVWEWKDKVYEEIRTFSGRELQEHLEKTVKDVEGKYGLKLKAHEVKAATPSLAE